MVAVVAAERPTECPTDQETDWSIELLLRHDDCDKFYKCTFGQPVVHQCPANLWFNLESWLCDWRENVDCSDRNVPGEINPEPDPEPEPKPEPEPESEPEPKPEPENDSELESEPKTKLELKIGVRILVRV